MTSERASPLRHSSDVVRPPISFLAHLAGVHSVFNEWFTQHADGAVLAETEQEIVILHLAEFGVIQSYRDGIGLTQQVGGMRDYVLEEEV